MKIYMISLDGDGRFKTNIQNVTKIKSGKIYTDFYKGHNIYESKIDDINPSLTYTLDKGKIETIKNDMMMIEINCLYKQKKVIDEKIENFEQIYKNMGTILDSKEEKVIPKKFEKTYILNKPEKDDILFLKTKYFIPKKMCDKIEEEISQKVGCKVVLLNDLNIETFEKEVEENANTKKIDQ